MDGRKRGTNKLNNGGREVGAKSRHDKQAQQVTTIGCGFANRALDEHSDPPRNGNDLKEPTSMTMGRQGGDEGEY